MLTLILMVFAFVLLLLAAFQHSFTRPDSTSDGSAWLCGRSQSFSMTRISRTKLVSV